MTKDMITKDMIRHLISKAAEARLKSYCPYSGFAVGAALLLKSGEVITGCNIENVSFGASNCAERTAIFKAVSQGKKDFVAIAVVGGKGEAADYCPPCGICLQVMAEFCDPEKFCVILSNSNENSRVYFLKELLPAAFTSLS